MTNSDDAKPFKGCHRRLCYDFLKIDVPTTANEFIRTFKTCDKVIMSDELCLRKNEFLITKF